MVHGHHNSLWTDDGSGNGTGKDRLTGIGRRNSLQTDDGSGNDWVTDPVRCDGPQVGDRTG